LAGERRGCWSLTEVEERVGLGAGCAPDVMVPWLTGAAGWEGVLEVYGSSI